jgi:TRAP-type uncharacterized transport system substrate-binding protein
MMPALARRHPRLVLLLAAVLSLALVLWAVFILAQALPPRKIVMTTGPKGDAEYDLGLRYRAILARDGVDLVVAASAGKLENLHRLAAPRSAYSVGLVSGGMAGTSPPQGVVSLGTISYDPLWIFCRDMPDPVPVDALVGKRVSIGPEGSATRALVLTLARLNHLEGKAEPLGLTPREGGEALQRGEIDCACMLTHAEAPIVRTLLADARISLMGFPRADAYVALLPYVRKLVLPMGIGNLPANRPSHDVPLIADAESLLVREDLHPAIQYLLLRAAEEIHSRAGIFQRSGQFPAAEPVDVALSSEALEYYKHGGTFLQRNLPFWLWVFASRLIVALVPLAGLVYPLAQLIPMARGFQVDRRLNQLYVELRRIEDRMEAADPLEEVAGDWRRFEDRVRKTKVPRSYARALYTLKSHASLVSERLTQLQARSGR